MSQKSSEVAICRLRIDPVLVGKFQRLNGGINEVGTKIVRDIGLKYEYDKKAGTLDILGPDTEILALAVETLRFWAEDDEFPSTGVTCQVGYPNRGLVVWRFHGDFAKKFDHLFTEDIGRLKLIPTVNIKAVPTKRNPEYIELYCHFSVYHKLKEEVVQITEDLGKIHQDDFFIPKSDYKKAKAFAVSNRKDDKVLYALKNYNDRVRVWMFARNPADVIRARKEWLSHVEVLAREKILEETSKRIDSEIRSASFIGNESTAAASETQGSAINVKNALNDEKGFSNSMSNLLSISLQRKISKPASLNKDVSPRVPKTDNSNFPRPPDFVYPVQKESVPETKLDTKTQNEPLKENTFAERLFRRNDISNDETRNSLAGEVRWVTDNDTTENANKRPKQSTNRIYIHHQVSNPSDQQEASAEVKDKKQGTKHPQANNVRRLRQIVHPSKKLAKKVMGNNTSQSGKQFITSTAKTQGSTAFSKKQDNLKPGEKRLKRREKNLTNRRPRLKSQKPVGTVKYNINVNGLNISMYQRSIVKIDNIDALINVVTSDLKHGDTVATEMLEAVGKQVIDEIDVHLSLYGDVQTSDNVVTSAGKLPALGIIHVVAPIWKTYTVWEECASDLHKAIYSALKTAESHKYREIAIPTIGSGECNLSFESSVLKELVEFIQFVAKKRLKVHVKKWQ